MHIQLPPMQGDTDGVIEVLRVADLDSDTVGVLLGVPRQIQRVSCGAPQERRQQSETHVDCDGDGEVVGVCVGAVADGVGVMH